jgi:glutathione S-transferase
VYELFIANKNYSSWSLRPWILMRERQIPFTERLMPLREDAAGASFRAVSPTGKLPCLHDGGVVVWDSLAIAEYLAERHDGVWPRDPVARAWARCAAAEMHAGFSALRTRCTMSCGIRVRLNEQPAALVRDLERLAELWNEGLARFGGPFLAGDAFGAVDAFYAPIAFRVQTYGLALAGPAGAYAERLLALAGMREWYAAALAETWRDTADDTASLAAGTLLEDLRAGA